MYRLASARRWAAIVVLVFGSSSAAVAPGSGTAEASTAAVSDTVQEQDVDFEVADFASDAGISLTEAEERLSWQEELPGLTADLETELGSAFGGVWVDPSDGDRIKVGVARQGASLEHDVAGRIADEHGLGDAVDVVSVTYSDAELRLARDQLAEDVVATLEASALPLSIGRRPSLNAVVLHLPAEAEADLPAELADLVEEARGFGDMVRLEYDAAVGQADACVHPYCDEPLRSGVRIISSNGTCSGGFLARSRLDNKLYQFTAGHCVVGGNTLWSTRLADGGNPPQTIGSIHNSRWNAGGDMAIIRVNNPDRWRARAWVFVTASADTERDESYNIASDGGSSEDQRICRSGGSSGSDCGRVTELDVTVRYCLNTTTCRTVERLGEASYCSTGGDSGGPVFNHHVAHGIHVAAAGPCVTYYQSIRFAENTMNVNVSHES